jgi:hypothetical protein
MKITFRIVSLAIVAALVFWLWTILFPGPEKIILKKISSLAVTATINANDSNLIRAAKAANVVDYFSTDVEISFDVPGQGAHSISGREEIREKALAGFAVLPSLKIQFLDATVRLGADKQTADVNCTMRVDIGDNKDYGVQEMRFQFRKIDGAWLITRVETVKTLS